MTDPKRLLDEGADDFERQLLRSAHRDVIPAQRRNAMVGALGVVAPPTLVALEPLSKTAPPVGGSPTAPPAAPLSAGSGAAPAALAGKGLIAAASTAVGAVAIWAGVSLSSPPAPTPAPPPNPIEPTANAELPRAPVPVHEQPIPEAPEEDAQPPPREEKPARAVPKQKAAPRDPLLRELDLIDSARQALRSHRPQLALQRLNAYDREFPKGSLRTEHMVLRIEALSAAGDSAAAARLGRRFLNRSRNGPYARRVRSLLDQSAP